MSKDSEYQRKVLAARRQSLKLVLKQEEELLKIYEEAGKQISERLSKSKNDSLNQRYLKELDKSIRQYVNELRQKLSKSIKDGITASTEIASNTQAEYFKSMGINTDLNPSFRNMFSQLSTSTVKSLINGNYYSDGKSLDKRIWELTSKNAKDIDKIIKINKAQNGSSRDLAKQLDEYVNPNSKTKAKTKIPGMNSKVSYQAQRLARTSMTHASNETYIQGSKANPFCVGLKWNLSPSHSARMHGKTDICDEYSSKVFEPDKYPVAHPNCLCYPTQEVESIDKARDELINWVKGEDNSKLDKWLEDYGEEFGIEKDDMFDELAASKEEDSGIINSKDFVPSKSIKEAESWALKNLKLNSSSYKDISLDVANYVNKSMLEIYEEYPLLKGFVNEIKTDGRASAPASASIMFKEGKLSTKLNLSKKHLSDLASIDEMISDCVDARWWTPKDGVKGIIKHEMGHMIEYALTLKKHGSINVNNELIDITKVNEAFKSINSGEISKEIKMKALVNLKMLNTKKNIVNNLSEYAYKSSLEFLAEALTEENPRPLAKEVIRLLKEKIKEVWK